MIALTPYMRDVLRKRHKDLRYTAIGPEENGTWRGCINIHDEKGRFASRLLLTEPEFKTKAQAIRGVKNQVSLVFRKDRVA